MKKKKYFRKTLISFLVIWLVVGLAGCDNNQSPIDYSDHPINMETNDDAIENLTIAYMDELTSTNPAYISYIQDQEFITNIYDALTAIDSSGNIIPSMAESWEHSDDYKTWTFHLRDDIYWVNYKGEIMDEIVADDFVTGFEFCINYWKSEGLTLFVVDGVVDGAREYLEYTTSLTSEEGRSITVEEFQKYVGIWAPDEKTVCVRTCNPCTFLPSVMASNVGIPASQKHIDEIGLDNYIISNYKTAWFNGPYLLTEFIKNNSRIIDANPNWWGNKEHTRFKSVTYKCVDDSSVAYQLYQNGEVDEVELSQSQLKRILDNENSPYHNKTTTRKSEWLSDYLLFCFYKKGDDNWNKAVTNTAFRQTFVYGLDNSPLCLYNNRANPKAVDSKTILPYGGGSLDDGTDYKDLVIELLDYKEENNSFVKNKDLFLKYKAQAIEELKAVGVTFPVDIDIYFYAGEQSSINFGRLIKEMLEDSLGSDFIRVNIKTYSSSYYIEVIDEVVSSMADSSYTYDYRDPSNMLGLFVYDNENNYTYEESAVSYFLEEIEEKGNYAYSEELINLLKEYKRMFDEANNIMENDERMYAFARAEAFLINNALWAIPCFNYKIELLTNIDEESMSISSICGYDKRYVDLKTHKAS